MAPRGHAKTESLSVNFPLWQIGVNPNIRILLAGIKLALAQRSIRKITRVIEGNVRFKNCFGELKPAFPSKWTDNEIIVARSSDSKDSTVSAIGVEGSAVGIRADIIVADDLFDEDNTRTKLQRDRVKEWFWESLYPILEPDGLIVVTGNRWHYDDIGADLLKNPNFDHKIYRAIQPDGTALWKERWPLERLEKRKQDMGSVRFSCQYMNMPIEDAELKVDWINENAYDKAPDRLRIYMTVDPAITLARGDYSAICIGGVDQDNTVYLLDFYRKQVDFPTQVREIIAMADKWHPSKIGVEAVAYQTALKQHLQATTMLPVVEIKQLQRRKQDRIGALAPHFENGRIRLPKHAFWRGWFDDEYVQFPKNDVCDDMLDATEMLFTLAATRKVDLTVLGVRSIFGRT